MIFPPPKPGTKIVGKKNNDFGQLYGDGIIVGYKIVHQGHDLTAFVAYSNISIGWTLSYIEQHYNITDENVWER